MSEANTTEIEPATPRSRRLLRWLLATLTVFVVGTLLLFGYRYQRQIAVIEAVGGHVETEPWGPVWLREFVGAERMRVFEDVLEVTITDDATGSLLCEFAGDPLVIIEIRGGKISEETLQCLGELRDLEALGITDVPELSEKFFERIANVKSLDLISISNTKLPGNAFSKLSELSRLNMLYLNDVEFDETNISELKKCKDLSWLDLSRSSLTDVGMEEIGQLTQMDRSLNLSGTGISDSGLSHIVSLKKIFQLRLSDTNVSDAGLEYLKAMTNLIGLEIERTKISSEGVEALRVALPKCDIDY